MPTNGCTSPELPSVATNNLIACKRARRARCDSLGLEILPEPRERLAPGRPRRPGVVAVARVIVKSVVDVRINDLAESLAVLLHRRLDRRNVLVDALVEPAVDGEHRRADTGYVALPDRHAVKRHRRPQIGNTRRDAPGDRSAEAEARHSDAVAARRGLRSRVREAALEILHVARGSRLAEDP